MTQTKGEKTKAALYESAKYIFYHYGYNNAMIKDIVARANSHLGVFTYHFKNKEAVAISIFNDFVDNITPAIHKTLSDIYEKNESDVVFLNMLEYRAYYKCLISNKNVQNFYCDLTYLQSFPSYLKEMTKAFNRNLIAGDHCSATHTHVRDEIFFNAIASITTGMDMQFFRDLINGELDIDFDDAIDLFLNEYYHLIIKNKAMIQTRLRETRKIMNTLDFQVKENFDVIIEKKL